MAPNDAEPKNESREARLLHRGVLAAARMSEEAVGECCDVRCAPPVVVAPAAGADAALLLLLRCGCCVAATAAARGGRERAEMLRTLLRGAQRYAHNRVHPRADDGVALAALHSERKAHLADQLQRRGEARAEERLRAAGRGIRRARRDRVDEGEEHFEARAPRRERVLAREQPRTKAADRQRLRIVEAAVAAAQGENQVPHKARELSEPVVELVGPLNDSGAGEEADVRSTRRRRLRVELLDACHRHVHERDKVLCKIERRPARVLVAPSGDRLDAIKYALQIDPFAQTERG
jgi:hypothetical protein